MDTGHWLTKLAIWISLGCAGWAMGSRLVSRNVAGNRWQVHQRWLWTLGWLACVVHVALAFAVYHGWSHAAAYADTARQTAEVTGFNWGGGVWFNYLFLALWTADVLWQWSDPASHARCPRMIQRLWQGFFLFMVFNAAVVFEQGVVRWTGVMGFAVLLALWLWSRARRPLDKPRVGS
jgi:hypothetical protein